MRTSDQILAMSLPAVAFAGFLSLAACTKETKPVPPATVVITGCEHFHLITASKADTMPTKTQILAHNTEYLKTCKASK